MTTARPSTLPPAAIKTLHEARQAAAKSDFKTAIALGKRVLGEHPESPEAMAALGFWLGVTGYVEKGLSLLERAVAAAPASGDFRVQAARVCMLAVRPERAIEHLAVVTEAEPRRLDALTMAAQCCERMNRLDEARSYAERALKIRRNDPEANLILGVIDAREKQYDAAAERLGKLASRRSIPVETHHRALTELGMVLDRQGKYEEAWGAFDAAAAEIAETPLVRSIDKQLAYRRIDAYRGRTPRGLLAKFEGQAFDKPAPCFLVGFPRSGTTMTEQVLAAHPAITTTDEQTLLNRMGNTLMQGASDITDVPARLEKLGPDKAAELRRVYWEDAERLVGAGPEAAADGRVFVDKLPLNIVDLAMINTVFPDSRVLVALRDPRDVCLSAFMQWFAPNAAMVHLLTLEGAARFYEAVMGAYLAIKPELSVPVLEVRYEDTVTDLEVQARRIVEHFGLPWDDNVLRFQEHAREKAIRTPSYEAVTEKVHTRAVGRWKNYEAHFQGLGEWLDRFCEAFGYERMG